MGSHYTPGEVTLPLGTNDYGDIQPRESLILGIYSSLWHRYQGSSKVCVKLMLKSQNSKQKLKKLNRHTSLIPKSDSRGGWTRSRAAIIADVAFISVWRLHKEKKHMVATNGCVFRSCLQIKYKLYTCRNYTAPSCTPALSWLLRLLRRDFGYQQPALSSCSI